MTEMNTERNRPCRLQINTTGAWRNVMEFDADDGELVMDNAPALFELARGAKLRIMGDASDTAPLVTWSVDKGWAKWRQP